MAKQWKKMTDEQKAHQRELCRKYRCSAKGRAKALARKRKWNAANREKKNTNDRAWYARHKTDTSWMADRSAVKAECRERNPEKYRDAQRAWNARHPLYHKEYLTMWRSLNPERVREYRRTFYVAHRERIIDRNREYRKTHPDRNSWKRRKLVFARDASKYASYREKCRKRNMLARWRKGLDYVPRMSRRIPDHIPFGISYALYARSQFVFENHERDRQREFSAYARELAIERKVWRDAQ